MSGHKRIFLNKKKVVEMHQVGMTIEKIANYFSVSITPIRKTLKENSISTKRKSEFHSKRAQKYKINDNFFNSINSQNKAYILGLLYSDGNMHQKKYVVSLELNKNEKNILEKINNELEHNKPLFIHNFIYKYKNTIITKTEYRLDITNYKIYQDLLSFGLIPNKSLTIKYPQNLSSELDRHFIRGYFDGDGCIYYKIINNKPRYVEFSILGTMDLCEKINNIFIKNLKISANIKKIRNVYRLRFQSKESLIKIYNFLYDDSNLFFNRKFEKFKLLYNLIKN